MQLSEATFSGGPPIDGYGPGFFRVAGEVHAGAVAVYPSGAAVWGGLDDLATLTDRAGEVDVLFLGTGAIIAHAPSALRAALEERNVGVEVMASPQACRTYNVLLSEGRRVAAALLPL